MTELLLIYLFVVDVKVIVLLKNKEIPNVFYRCIFWSISLAEIILQT